ncbi:hypothetical protein V8C26DRAFT_119275 [Trichoderma gracile]
MSMAVIVMMMFGVGFAKKEVCSGEDQEVKCCQPSRGVLREKRKKKKKDTRSRLTTMNAGGRSPEMHCREAGGQLAAGRRGETWAAAAARRAAGRLSAE